MIENNEEKIVIRCPHCGFFAFDILLKEGQALPARITTKCRHCKRQVVFPEESDHTTKKLIREGDHAKKK